jgi:hypothetical protein
MKKFILFSLIALIAAVISTSCVDGNGHNNTVSDSGVEKASVTVITDSNGNTIEQKNIVERLKRDNQPGSIKHLYVISAYSGQTLIYSTVNGKVTSSGKRLTPATVCGNGFENPGSNNSILIGGTNYTTNEVLGDDGAYGSSDPYIYWFDVKGVYHQHYLAGGQIIHISDQPLAVKSIVLNMELK